MKIRLIFLHLAIIASLLSTLGCNENPSEEKKLKVEKTIKKIEPVYVKRAWEDINDYWFMEKDELAKQISILENFDNTKLDDWKALIKYGYIHTESAVKLKKRRVIFYSNSKLFVKPSGVYSEMPSATKREIFARFHGMNGTFMFMPTKSDKYTSSYYKVYNDNIEKLEVEFPEVNFVPK